MEKSGWQWLQFDGTNFDGILLWIFTGDSVNTSGTVTSGTRSVSNVKDIFYPEGSGSNYHHFYPIAINPDGTIVSNTTSGASGWNFSSNSSPNSTTGYYSAVSGFSNDDGIWAFKIPGYVDGDVLELPLQQMDMVLEIIVVVVIIVLMFIGMELMKLNMIRLDLYSVVMHSKYM